MIEKISAVKRFAVLLRQRYTHKHYYMVATDFDGKNISIKCPKQSDIEYVKKLLPDEDWLECGAITYWFMKHSMPKIAYLSFWR